MLPICFLLILSQWWQKLEDFEGDGDKQFGGKGCCPLKTHRFWPICLLHINNFATFLCFYLLFFISLSYFSSSSFFFLGGDVNLTENFSHLSTIQTSLRIALDSISHQPYKVKMQYVFFRLHTNYILLPWKRFLQKLADDQCSSITKSSIYIPYQTN